MVGIVDINGQALAVTVLSTHLCVSRILWVKFTYFLTIVLKTEIG